MKEHNEILPAGLMSSPPCPLEIKDKNVCKIFSISRNHKMTSADINTYRKNLASASYKKKIVAKDQKYELWDDLHVDIN